MTAAPAPATGTDQRPSRMNAVVAWCRTRNGRVLGGCLFGALVLALMTGPSGNAQHLTAGVRGSWLSTHVIGFLIFGVVLWLAIISGSRLRSRIQPVTEVIAGVRERAVLSRPVAYVGYAVALALAIFIPPQMSVFWQQ